MSTLERIAFDGRYINDRYHGIGRYAFRLLEALSLGQGAGTSSTSPRRTFVIFRGREPEGRFGWEELASCSDVELWEGPPSLYWPQEQLIWPSMLRRAGVTLFHSPYFIAPLLTPCPVIITVQDLIFDRYPRYMPWRWLRPYYRLLMTMSIRRASRIITLSQATADELVHFYGPPSDKIAVIPAGVDPSFSPITDAWQLWEVCHRYKLEQPFVLSVGVRRPHKNLTRLVRAFVRQAPNTRHDLVLVGPADERFPDEARRVATAESISDRIRFLDWVPESDLIALYTLADLVVIPSLAEGFGLPALEAMACGTAVLAADVSALPEVVGEMGALVDPYDEEALACRMRELLEEDSLRHRLAEAGRARAASFTWHRAAQQVRHVYQEALN